MKRFLKPKDNSASTSQNDCDQQVTAKRPCLSGVEGTSSYHRENEDVQEKSEV